MFHSSRRRAGFTLLELVVVLGIAAILMALTASAAFRVYEKHKISMTETLIKKVNSMLDRQWKAVIDQARDDVHAGDLPADVLTFAGGDLHRATSVWIKMKLKQQFPMTYAEALTPLPGGLGLNLPPEPAYVTYLGSAAGGMAEPGACLLMALTAKSRRGIPFDPDLFIATEFGDMDRDGIKEIIDAWGTPLYFCRWPYGNVEVDDSCPGGPAIAIRDPQDSTGTMLSPSWGSAGGGNRVIFSTNFHPIDNPRAGTLGIPNPSSIYLVPVVVSAGKDKAMALDAIMTIQGPQADDNIYSFLLR